MKRNEKPMKERILEEALQLFSQNGYTGTSMNDIAAKLGVTKAALYKHYKSKQEILDSIVEKASEYGLPEEQQGEDFLSERQVSYDDIKTYTKEQFSYWSKRRIPKLFPESADAGAVPRSADGKSLSEISGKRASVLYGADF